MGSGKAWTRVKRRPLHSFHHHMCCCCILFIDHEVFQKSLSRRSAVLPIRGKRVARLLFSMAHALARSSDPAHRTKHMVLILHAANIALTSEDRSCFRSSTASSPASKICASAVITSIISSKHSGVTRVPTATVIAADVVAALDLVHKPHRQLQLPGG